MLFSRVKMKAGWTYVYRIEHAEDNTGPYNSGRNCKRLSMHASQLGCKHSDYNHPTIWDDVMNSYVYKDWKMNNPDKDWRDCHCGFEDLQMLKRWFNKQELMELESLEYVVKFYRIQSHHLLRTRSGRQCMFLKPVFPTKVKKISEILA